MEDAIDRSVSGASDPLSSSELQLDAEGASSGARDDAAAVGGDTHLRASESELSQGTGAAGASARGAGEITYLPAD
jgi:hypothetical protein